MEKQEVVIGDKGARGVYAITLDERDMKGLEFCAHRYTSGRALLDVVRAAWRDGRCLVDGAPPVDSPLSDGGTFYLTEPEAWEVNEKIRGGAEGDGDDGGTIPCFGSMEKVNALLDEVV